MKGRDVHAIRKNAMRKVQEKAAYAAAYVPPKMKVRSDLSSQRDIEGLFDHLDERDEDRFWNTLDYRDNIYAKVGAESRKTLTREEMTAV